MGIGSKIFRTFSIYPLFALVLLFSSCGLILDQLNAFGSNKSDADSSSPSQISNQGGNLGAGKANLNPGVGLDNGGSSASCYFTRPESAGHITLKVVQDSDIWYVFTNTSGRNIEKPYYIIPTLDVLPVESGIVTKRITDDVLPPSSQVVLNPLLPNIIVSKDEENKDTVALDDEAGSEIKSDISYFELKKDGLGDYIGKKTTFYEANSGYITATCKLYRSVKTQTGERTLVIYEQDDMKYSKNLPTDSDYRIIADAFLKDGLDNDIYDKLTSLFGSDWGYLNSTFLSQNSTKLFYKKNISNYLIPQDDTITILYCDVANQGEPTDSYIGGYFFNGNNFSSSYYSKSNQRAMVTLHAYVSGGSFIGEGLSVLAHEFQHLIHDQYFNQNLSIFGYDRPNEETSAMTECFSSIAESYTAQFISESTGKEVRGPFCVGYGKNDSGYLTRNSNGNALINGRGPYYLSALDKYNVVAWETESKNANQLLDYGLVASFGYYLLVNYGAPTLRAYVSGDKVNLEGIVEAVNNSYSDAKMTKSKLMADWITAVMLSSYPHLSTPYAHNKLGWYVVNGMKVPSVNMWNYTPYPNVVDNYYNNVFGIQSQNLGVVEFKNNTNNPMVVKRGIPAGTIYSASAPALPDGLALTVIAVPR